MSDGRKPKLKERDVDLPQMKIELESETKGSLTAEQIYLKRQVEVAQQDNEQFSDYLRKKTARDEQEKTQAAPAPQAIPVSQPGPKKLNRRSLLTWAAGTAVVGEAVTLGYPMLSGQNIPDHGARHAGATYTEPQRHPIDRELVNPQADVGGRRFGDWVLLMPTKMGGGTYAVNLNTGRALAWVSYWNYGDYNPISHHLCAFPSADPAKGFEWINSTQGGKNSLIYGIPTHIEAPDEGFNIYRVRYDGAQMEVLENVSETTGMGLGVHVTIDPQRRSAISSPTGRRISLLVSIGAHRASSRPSNTIGCRTCASSPMPGRKAACSRSPRSIPIRQPASTTIAAPKARRSNV